MAGLPYIWNVLINSLLFQIGDGFVAIRVPLIFKLGGGWFAIHLKCVYKLSFIVAIKNHMNLTIVFLNRRQKVSKVGKKSDFSYFTTFCCIIFQSQCMAFQPYGV